MYFKSGMALACCGCLTKCNQERHNVLLKLRLELQVIKTDLSQHLDISLVDCQGNPGGAATDGKLVQGRGSCAAQGGARQVHDTSGKESGAAGTPLLPPSRQDLHMPSRHQQCVVLA